MNWFYRVKQGSPVGVPGKRSKLLAPDFEPLRRAQEWHKIPKVEGIQFFHSKELLFGFGLLFTNLEQMNQVKASDNVSSVIPIKYIFAADEFIRKIRLIGNKGSQGVTQMEVYTNKKVYRSPKTRFGGKSLSLYEATLGP